MFRKKSVRDKQSGRSMVEMLAVLALIGVLSITGVVGIQYAMQIYRENETVNEFSVATVGARTAELMQNYIYNCTSFPCPVPPRLVITTKHPVRDNAQHKDFTTAIGAPVMVRIEDQNGYTVRIRGISKEICEAIKSSYWGETCAGIDKRGGLTPYRADECADLKQMDCAQFENATSGMIRRSLMQQDIDIGKYMELPLAYSDANYNALVLYYGERALEGDEYDHGWEAPNSYEDDGPQSDSPECLNNGTGYDTNMKWTMKCCLEDGGRWADPVCCSSETPNVDIIGRQSSSCAMPGTCSSCGGQSFEDSGETFCCKNNQFEIDVSTCQPIGPCPRTMCPPGCTLEGEKCCEGDDFCEWGPDGTKQITSKGCLCKRDGSGENKSHNVTSDCCDVDGYTWVLGECCRGSYTQRNVKNQPSRTCCENLAGGEWLTNGTCCKKGKNKKVKLGMCPGNPSGK